MMAVRVRSPAPLDTGGLLDVGRRVRGDEISRPHSSVVEHFLGKEEVTGSSPVVGSKTVRIDQIDTYIIYAPRMVLCREMSADKDNNLREV